MWFGEKEWRWRERDVNYSCGEMVVFRSRGRYRKIDLGIAARGCYSHAKPTVAGLSHDRQGSLAQHAHIGRSVLD